MYLHDRFRVCLQALESRYPIHEMILNGRLLRLDTAPQRTWTSEEMLSFLQQHAPHLLEDMAMLRIDDQATEIYVPTYSTREPACSLHCRGRTSALARRVAIVGAGPTGLSAAYDLRRHGYLVTVFDALPQAGGALTDAIPDTRLPKTLVTHTVMLLQQSGVELQLHTAIGRDLPFSALQSRFDAILLAIGTQQSEQLHISGETLLSGIIPARQFLHAFNSGQKMPSGKQVVVIGGDRTAVLAARTALEAGAQKVQLVFEGTRTMMTASPEEIEAALEEGIALHELMRPRNFIGTEEATLSAVRCDHMALSEPDDQGQRYPKPIHGRSTVFPADIILVAAGERPDLSCFPLDVPNRPPTRKDEPQSEEDHRTSVPGLFVAGGVLYGPGTITQAVAHGKQAARVIVAFLQGITPSEVPELPDDALSIAAAPGYLRESMHKKT